MSENERERIRERKKDQLRSEHGDRSTASTGSGSDQPIHAESEAHFEEVTGSGDVVLVDFYADWCGPCQMLEPIVESIAASTSATVLKVDVDEHQALAGRFQVQGVPTLLVFADGDLAERMVGMQREADLRAVVDEYA